MSTYNRKLRELKSSRDRVERTAKVEETFKYACISKIRTPFKIEFPEFEFFQSCHPNSI